jgi:ABC-type sugar transport system permease subunit
VAGFQLFELPYVLYQGVGPGARATTIVMYLFMTGFDVGDLGYASAIGWMLVVIVAAVSVVQYRVAIRFKE